MSPSYTHFWRLFSWGRRSHYGLCCITFPCFWVMTHQLTPNACSGVLGVSCDLKYNLGNTRVTSTKKFIMNPMFVMFHWTRSWVPDKPIALAWVVFLLPPKTLFLIYNSHDLKKSIGNLKCKTSSWLGGHFYLINTAWGSWVIFLCHIRPKKRFLGSFRPLRLIFGMYLDRWG